MTDNRNRTVAEIRHILTKFGGNLGENGCVAWMFAKKGVITVELDSTNEDTLMEVALEAGGEDISADSGAFEVLTTPEALEDVRAAIEAKGIPMVSAEIVMQPSNTVRIDDESAASSMLKMYDMLEELDDIQKIYSNFDIEESLLEKLAS